MKNRSKFQASKVVQGQDSHVDEDDLHTSFLSLSAMDKGKGERKGQNKKQNAEGD
jgi:hypothetical protein